MGCKSCQKKKKHHKKKHHSSSDAPKKVKGISCACCAECKCYKYGGKEGWHCKCGCDNCKCGLKADKLETKVKKKKVKK